MMKNIDEKEKNKRERNDKIKTQIDGVIEKATIGKATSQWINEDTGEIISLLNEDGKAPHRVEAYDISNINGIDNVGLW